MESILSYQEYVYVPGLRYHSDNYQRHFNFEAVARAEGPDLPLAYYEFMSYDFSSPLLNGEIRDLLGIREPNDIESATWVVQEKIHLGMNISGILSSLNEEDILAFIQTRLARNPNSQGIHVKIRGQQGFVIIKGNNDNRMRRTVWTDVIRISV